MEAESVSSQCSAAGNQVPQFQCALSKRRCQKTAAELGSGPGFQLSGRRMKPELPLRRMTTRHNDVVTSPLQTSDRKIQIGPGIPGRPTWCCFLVTRTRSPPAQANEVVVQLRLRDSRTGSENSSARLRESVPGVSCQQNRKSHRSHSLSFTCDARAPHAGGT